MLDSNTGTVSGFWFLVSSFWLPPQEALNGEWDDLFDDHDRAVGSLRAD
jgi:hypothetical protein